ncbi:MAG: hypothetical protein ACRDOK_20560, partial [Streptosporangiaceae bacterium]
TQITVTTPTVSALSKLWPIPAGDAKAGTKYTLEVWGSGENESNDPWAPIFVLGGSSYYIVNVPTGSDWVSGLLSGWKAQFQFTVISTGTSGVVIAAGRFEVGEPGTSSNTYFSWYSGGTLNMDTTIANSFNLDWRWWSVPGSPTITSYASSLERVGP